MRADISTGWLLKLANGGLAGGILGNTDGGKSRALGRFSSGNALKRRVTERNFRGGANFSSGTTKLSSGTTKLSSGTANISSGTANISSGTANISSGTTNISSGTTNISSGITNISSGTTKLSSGTTKLSSGTTKLSSGTTNISSGSGLFSCWAGYSGIRQSDSRWDGREVCFCCPRWGTMGSPRDCVCGRRGIGGESLGSPAAPECWAPGEGGGPYSYFRNQHNHPTPMTASTVPAICCQPGLSFSNHRASGMMMSVLVAATARTMALLPVSMIAHW